MHSPPQALESFDEFLDNFKRATEADWESKSIDSTGYGFQIQPGTRWNPGLSENDIEEYQTALGAQFPPDFKAFLRKMNGTDLPTLNVYGSSGYPAQQSVGVYSYPGDIKRIMERVDDIRRNRMEITRDLAEQGFHLPNGADLVPIISHRYLVCSPGNESSTVLSIIVDDVDAIVYAYSLREYLSKEFFS